MKTMHTSQMRKTIIIIAMILLIIAFVLALFDVISNRYIIASTYFALAIFMGFIYFTIPKNK